MGRDFGRTFSLFDCVARPGGGEPHGVEIVSSGVVDESDSADGASREERVAVVCAVMERYLRASKDAAL